MQGPHDGARHRTRLIPACALAVAGALFSWSAFSPARAAQQPAPAQAASAAPAGVRVAQAQPRPETRPAWSELSVEQRTALKPLGARWSSLSEGQKRKWIALSRNYARMSPQEQATLHSRMTDWVSLSPRQRAQARLNFGETRDLSPDDKKAKWEAYQALSPEEKRKLAAGADTRTPPTAAAVKPVPSQKLTQVPRAERGQKPPRITNGPAPPAAAPGATN